MNEEQIKLKFDRIITDSGLFSIYREVDGFYIQPRNTGLIKAPRIDRILVPKQKIIDSKYNYGIIGVELKADDHKIGRPLLQVLDYMRSVFALVKNGVYYASIMLDTCFVFPFEELKGDTESITKQNLIGTGTFTNKGLKLKFGSINFLEIENGEMKNIIKKELFTFGKKVGSR